LALAGQSGDPDAFLACFTVFWRVLACFGVFLRVCGIALPGWLEVSAHLNFKERRHISPRCIGSAVVPRKCNVFYYAMPNSGGGTKILILHGFTSPAPPEPELALLTRTRRASVRKPRFG